MTAAALLIATPTVGDRFVLKPAPRREPPYDDELSPHLTLVGPHDRPLPFDRLDPRLTRGRREVATTFGRQPSSRDELPELMTFVRRFVIGIIETATGRRPAAQLGQHTTLAVQAGLSRDAGRMGRLGSAQRPASLHSLHVSEPLDGVAEVAAVVCVGERFRAIALRLEGLDGRWRCVRLQIG